MNIKKQQYIGWFYCYYRDSKTNSLSKRLHGLFNGADIGYEYHNQQKGFWLLNKKYL